MAARTPGRPSYYLDKITSNVVHYGVGTNTALIEKERKQPDIHVLSCGVVHNDRLQSDLAE